MSTNAEEFIIKLNEQISPGARVAESALAQLEARIHSQKQALGGYEAKLASAAAKLQTMSAGGKGGSVNIASFRKQQAAVAALQQKVEEAGGSLAKLGGAQSMAGQVSTMQAAEAAIRAASQALEELQAKQQLVGAAGGSGDMTAAIRKQRAEIVRTQQAYVKMGGTFKKAMAVGGVQKLTAETKAVGTAAAKSAGQVAKLSKATSKTEFKPNELAEGFGQLGGAFGGTGNRAFSLVEGLGKLKGQLGTVGAAGVVGTAIFLALAVAVVAVVAAMVAGVVAVARWGVGLADAARSAKLTNDAIELTHKSLEGLGSIIPAVTRATGIAGTALQGMAKQLAAAGVTAKEMPAALKAVATAESALGSGGASKFIARLKEGKTSVAKLAKEVESKFGGIVAKRMLSLNSLSARFGRTLGETFGGLDIEPLLEGLSKMVDLFDTSTTSGQALKFLFETIFQPIINAAVAAIPVVKMFFLGLILGALKVANALHPVIAKAKEFFGIEGDSSLEGTLNAAAQAGQFLAIALTLAAAIAGVAFVVLGSAVALVLGPLLALPIAAQKAGTMMRSSLQGAIAYLQGIDLSAVGSAMISGLANGITSAGGAVLSAITGVVGGAIASAQGMLEINSPSKVFQRMGASTGEGMQMGVEGSKARVHKTIGDMVLPKLSSGSASSTTASSSSGDGSAESVPAVQVDLRGSTFSGGLTQEGLEEMLTPIFARLALSLG